MADINYSNERVMVDSEATIGTTKLTANLEKKGGKLARIMSGNIFDNGTHIGNFGMEENGYLYSNIFRNPGIDVGAVYAALVSYIDSLEADNTVA